MRYYCRSCRGVFETGKKAGKGRVPCPICSNFSRREYLGEGVVSLGYDQIMKPIPDYETPMQYEKRTGEPLSDNAAVWFRVERIYSDSGWGLCRYISAKQDHDICVCAHGPNPPPYDWKPEEGV